MADAAYEIGKIGRCLLNASHFSTGLIGGAMLSTKSGK